MVDRVGERFGDYQIKRLLSSRGAFADVYEGEHVLDRTRAAVKIWKVQIEAKTFLNDVRAAVLRHPHIVEILDFHIKDDIPYLVMAYAANGSLQAQPLPLPLDSIVAYVRQIADALFYAHQRGIVHCDIKPDNILLGPQKEVWVGDFGIAVPSYTRRDTLREEPEKQIIGTPDYMAPEQWEDRVSPASDQYALGVTVYEWLCGERPFRGNMVALYQKHANEPPPSLCKKRPTVSPEVEHVIMRALEKKPENRFPSVWDFANALEQACVVKQRPHKQSPTGTLLYSYQASQRSIYSFSWMQNIPRLATIDADGQVKVRDLATENLVFSRREEGLGQILWSPDGQRLAYLIQDMMDREPTKLHVWNPDTGKHLASYTHALEPLIWSPDGTRIAFLRYSDNHEEDVVFQVWNIDPLQLISTLPASDEMIGAAKPVWSPDGQYIAFSPEHIPDRIYTWGQWVIPVHEIGKEDAIITYPLQLPPIPRYVSNHPRWSLPEGKLIWSPDGTYLANWASYSCSGTMRLPDSDDEQRWQEYFEKAPERRAQIWITTTKSEIAIRSDVLALAWSPDSTQVAFALGNHTVEIWDISADKIVATYRGHTAGVVALAWSPDKKHLASASIDGSIHVWDVNDARCILMIKSDLLMTRKDLDNIQRIFDKKWATLEWSSDGTQLAFLIGTPNAVSPRYDGRGYSPLQRKNRDIIYNIMLQIWQVFSRTE